ncbi:MAG: glycine cleavage system protein GcvH [Acidobacteriota bacterium]
MNVPEDLLYTRQHEWVLVNEKVGTVGITDYAQSELGDVVYVELPEAGESLDAQQVFGSIESVKAVSEVYTPISGEVVESNESLTESPETVNEDPYGEGWMIRIQINDPSELDGLMSAQEYSEYVKQETEE